MTTMTTLLQEGKIAYQKGDYFNAIRTYIQAQKLDQKKEEPYLLLGCLYLDLKQISSALKIYQKGLKNIPKSEKIHIELGHLYLESIKDYLQSIFYFSKAIKLNPANIYTFFDLCKAYEYQNSPDDALKVLSIIESGFELTSETKLKLATQYAHLGKSAEAERYFQAVLTEDPSNESARWHLSYLQLRHKDFHQGLKNFEARLSNEYKNSKAYNWNVQQLSGKHILLIAEQGLGDTIQFARYIPLLKQLGAKVTLKCQDSLVSLMQSSFDIDLIAESSFPSDFDYDYSCPLMSLPYKLNLSEEKIYANTPYLKVSPEKQFETKVILQETNRLNIGLTWKGNPLSSFEPQRSISLENLRPLWNRDHTNYYILQKTLSEQDHALLDSELKSVCLMEKLHTFLDTAAIIEQLDLVITIDSAVAHLAGALGKKTFLILPAYADWRWFDDTTKTPWYPNTTIFKAKQGKSIDVVINQVCKELKELK